MKPIDTWFKDKLVDHVTDKRRAWVYALDGTSSDPVWIDDRINRMKSSNEGIRSVALGELSGLPRVVDAEVRIKALEGIRAKERKGKTKKDGIYGILTANSGDHDLHISHPGYNDFYMSWKIQYNPEHIPAVFRP